VPAGDCASRQRSLPGRLRKEAAGLFFACMARMKQ